jgi:hypothetical protein
MPCLASARLPALRRGRRQPVSGIAAFAGSLALVAAAAAQTATASGDPATERLRQLQAEVDRTSLVPMAALQQLGFRVDWQTRVPNSRGGTLRGVHARGDSIYAIDSRNLVSRVSLDRGMVVWQSPVGEASMPIEAVFRVTRPGSDEIYAASSFAIHVIDGADGSTQARQGLERGLGTPPTVVGPYMIYGTRSGQVIWHQYEVGYPWRANSLPGSISARPLLDGDRIYAVGSTGAVMAMDAASTRRVWERQLVDGVVAAPAAGDGLLFVAGTDQHLWAFDMGSGRTAWSYFTESPLTTPPTALGDSVLQFVPNEGLVCLAANPTDRISGVVRWRNPEGRGVVIGSHRGRVLLWEAAARTLRGIELATGRTAFSIELPRVDAIAPEGGEGGGLLLFRGDGTIIRLLPQA